MNKIFGNFLLFFLVSMSHPGYAQPGTYIKNLGVCSRYFSVDNDSSIYVMLNNTIVRTDYEGRILFRKHYDAEMCAIASCSAGGIATLQVEGSYGSQNAILSRINTSGEKIWQAQIMNGRYFYSYTIKECRDKGFIIAVYSDNVMFIRTDSSGKEIWRNKASVSTWGEAHNIIETADSNFFVLIRGSIFKLNWDGELKWQKSYNNPVKLLNSENNGIALLGNDYLRKMDSEGNLIWRTTIPGKIISAVNVDSCYLISTHSSVMKIDNNKNVIWSSLQTLQLLPISIHKDKILFLNYFQPHEYQKNLTQVALVRSDEKARFTGILVSEFFQKPIFKGEMAKFKWLSSNVSDVNIYHRFNDENWKMLAGPVTNSGTFETIVPNNRGIDGS